MAGYASAQVLTGRAPSRKKVFRDFQGHVYIAVLDKKAVAGTDLFTDGGLEIWTDPTNLTNWTEIAQGTSSVARNGASQRSGTYCAQLNIDGSNSDVGIEQVVSVSSGSLYVLSFWHAVSSGGQAQYSFRDESSSDFLKDDGSWSAGTNEFQTASTSATYIEETKFLVPDFTGNMRVQIHNYTAASKVILLDDCEISIRTPQVDIYKSVDDGRTFTLHSNGPQVPTDRFDLFVDDQNRFFLAVESPDGGTKPTVYEWDGTSSWDLVYELSSNAYTDCQFAIDTNDRPAANPAALKGSNNFKMVGYKDDSGQDNVYYVDTAFATDIRVNAQVNDQANPRMAVDESSRCFVAWHRTSDNTGWMAQQVTQTNSFGTPVQFSDAAHTVVDVCDCRINTLTGLPGVIYKRDNSSTYEVWLAELLHDGVTWLRTQVWDGTNNVHHYGTLSNQKLAYDARGSVFVTSYNDVPGGAAGIGEPYSWHMWRALGGTTWSANAHTVTASGGTPDTNIAVASLRNPEINTARPSEFRQGIAVWAWIWPTSGAETGSEAWYINYDEWPGTGVYPVWWAPVVGPPAYRARLEEVDEDNQDSIVFAGEGAAATTYPLHPDSVIEITPHEVYEANALLPYRMTSKKYVNTRRRWTVPQTMTDNGEKTTLTTFIDARMDDLAPFTLTWMDKDNVQQSASVFFWGEALNMDDFEYLDNGGWFIEFEVRETL